MESHWLAVGRHVGITLEVVSTCDDQWFPYWVCHELGEAVGSAISATIGVDEVWGAVVGLEADSVLLFGSGVAGMPDAAVGVVSAAVTEQVRFATGKTELPPGPS